MKQMTSPNQMVALSPIAKKKLNNYCRKKEWGMVTDDGFISITQLTIGQLLEFIKDNTNDETITLPLTSEPVDILWKKVMLILEEKN